MKILIVKRDKIGDLLLATPMLAHLRASEPSAEIHLLANDYNAWVVEGNACIDHLWVYRRVRQAGRFNFTAAIEAFRLRRALQRERFDWVVVANGDESPRAIHWGLAAQGARTVAYCRQASRYWALTDPLPVREGMHELDRLLNMLFVLDIALPAKSPPECYALPRSAADFARAWLAKHKLSPNGFIVLGLGARQPKKQPSAEQVIRWSTHFKNTWNLDTVFMWTPGKPDEPLYPGDDEVAQPVLDAQSPFIYPFRGPLREALGLLWSARTSLFPDSGLMHFAAASPGGVLGLFADTSVSPAPSQWGPRGPKADWLEAEKSVAELSDALIYERVGALLRGRPEASARPLKEETGSQVPDPVATTIIHAGPHAPGLHANPFATALALIGVIGYLDYVTGPYLSLWFLYLAPVCMTTWSYGRLAGIACSIVAAGGLFAIGEMSGHPYPDKIHFLFATLWQFSTYIGASVLFARIRSTAVSESTASAGAVAPSSHRSARSIWSGLGSWVNSRFVRTGRIPTLAREVLAESHILEMSSMKTPRADASLRRETLPTFVISLQWTRERRQLMEAQFNLQGMPRCRFLEAVDGRKLGAAQLAKLYDRSAALQCSGRDLTAPEIGCSLSHLAAYREVVEQGVPLALILEDDALLGSQVHAVLDGLLSMLDLEKPQVVLLSHVGRYSAWGGQRIDKLHSLYRPYHAYGTYAYLITRSGAKAMLAALQPVRVRADDWRYIMNSQIVELFGVIPYPVGLAPVSSTIGEPGIGIPASHGWRRWARKYLWQKFAFQLLKPALRIRKQASTW